MLVLFNIIHAIVHLVSVALVTSKLTHIDIPRTT